MLIESAEGKSQYPYPVAPWARHTVGVLLAVVAGALWFVADAGWRELLSVAAMFLAGLVGWRIAASVVMAIRGARWAVMGAAVAGLASWWGGLGNGIPWIQVTGMSILWAGAVVGLGCMLAVAMGGRAETWSRAVAVMFALVVAASLIGYLIGAERWMLVEWTAWGNLEKRLASVWPCRWWAGGAQRIWWDHPNIGAWFFACGLGMLLEAGWRRSGGGWRALAPISLLIAASTCALFLTASRSGYLVAAAVIPAVLIGRSWRWAGLASGAILLGLAVGWGMLLTKVPPVSAKAGPEYDQHVTGLVTRLDAGRLSGYRLWAKEEMPGHWWFGRGIAATGKPMPSGMAHEHSMLVATVRGGGLLALGGQILVLGTSAWGALRLARAGRRSALVLWLAVITGFLFDRSSVFRAAETPEFFAHWAAAWWPWIALRNSPARPPAQP